jgi:hypothetical protein
VSPCDRLDGKADRVCRRTSGEGAAVGSREGEQPGIERRGVTASVAAQATTGAFPSATGHTCGVARAAGCRRPERS